MPAQDKTDLLAIALDKRVAALEAQVKALDATKQDKKDDALVAQKMQAQLNKQLTDQVKQQAEMAKQQAKEIILETRLKVLEAQMKAALTMASSR